MVHTRRIGSAALYAQPRRAALPSNWAGQPITAWLSKALRQCPSPGTKAWLLAPNPPFMDTLMKVPRFGNQAGDFHPTPATLLGWAGSPQPRLGRLHGVPRFYAPVIVRIKTGKLPPFKREPA